MTLSCSIHPNSFIGQICFQEIWKEQWTINFKQIPTRKTAQLSSKIKKDKEIRKNIIAINKFRTKPQAMKNLKSYQIILTSG